jgi:Mg2+ and Co2+ transporter CorA
MSDTSEVSSPVSSSGSTVYDIGDYAASSREIHIDVDGTTFLNPHIEKHVVQTKGRHYSITATEHDAQTGPRAPQPYDIRINVPKLLERTPSPVGPREIHIQPLDDVEHIAALVAEEDLEEGDVIIGDFAGYGNVAQRDVIPIVRGGLAAFKEFRKKEFEYVRNGALAYMDELQAAVTLGPYFSNRPPLSQQFTTLQKIKERWVSLEESCSMNMGPLRSQIEEYHEEGKGLEDNLWDQLKVTRGMTKEKMDLRYKWTPYIRKLLEQVQTHGLAVDANIQHYRDTLSTAYHTSMYAYLEYMTTTINVFHDVVTKLQTQTDTVHQLMRRSQTQQQQALLSHWQGHNQFQEELQRSLQRVLQTLGRTEIPAWCTKWIHTNIIIPPPTLPLTVEKVGRAVQQLLKNMRGVYGQLQKVLHWLDPANMAHVSSTTLALDSSQFEHVAALQKRISELNAELAASYTHVLAYCSQQQQYNSTQKIASKLKDMTQVQDRLTTALQTTAQQLNATLQAIALPVVPTLSGGSPPMMDVPTTPTPPSIAAASAAIITTQAVTQLQALQTTLLFRMQGVAEYHEVFLQTQQQLLQATQVHLHHHIRQAWEDAVGMAQRLEAYDDIEEKRALPLKTKDIELREYVALVYTHLNNVKAEMATVDTELATTLEERLVCLKMEATHRGLYSDIHYIMKLKKMVTTFLADLSANLQQLAR